MSKVLILDAYDTLAALVDEHGLERVVTTLAEIATHKAEDADDVAAWYGAAGVLARAAATPDVRGR